MNFNLKENQINFERNKSKAKNKKVSISSNKIHYYSFNNNSIRRKTKLNIIKLNEVDSKELKHFNIEYSMDTMLVDKLFKLKKSMSK